MRIQHSTASNVILTLVLTVAVSLCFPPAWAQSAAPSNPASPAPLAPVPSNSQANAASGQQTPGQQTTATPQANSTTANPSQPPLQPVTTYPDAAGNPQKQMDAETQAQANGQSQAPQTEPQGAATAEKVPTAGGAAAKPAGAAIAPAKQRQVRSLLIKLGAVAAGAVAAGTIYGLSRGTPSTPPGSTSPAAVQKR